MTNNAMPHRDGSISPTFSDTSDASNRKRKRENEASGAKKEQNRQKRSRTRKNNVKHACVACKQRHVRCDDAKPCHHCVKRKQDCRIQVFVADENGELKETFQVFSWDGKLQNGKARNLNAGPTGEVMEEISPNAQTMSAPPTPMHAGAFQALQQHAAPMMHPSQPMSQMNPFPSYQQPSAAQFPLMHPQKPQPFPTDRLAQLTTVAQQQLRPDAFPSGSTTTHASLQSTQVLHQHGSTQDSSFTAMGISAAALDFEDMSIFPPPFGLLSPETDIPGEGLYTDLLQQHSDTMEHLNDSSSSTNASHTNPSQEHDLFSALSSTVQHQSTIIKSLMAHIDQLTRAIHEQREQYEQQMHAILTQSSHLSGSIPRPSTSFHNPFTEAYATDVPACLIALPKNQFNAKLLLWNDAYLQMVGQSRHQHLSNDTSVDVDFSNFYNVPDHLRLTANGLLRMLMGRYYTNSVPVVSGSRTLRLCGKLLRARWKISHSAQGRGVSLVFASYTPVDAFDDSLEVNGLRFEATMVVPDNQRLSEEQLFSLHNREMQALSYLNCIERDGRGSNGGE